MRAQAQPELGYPLSPQGPGATCAEEKTQINKDSLFCQKERYPLAMLTSFLTPPKPASPGCISAHG